MGRRQRPHNADLRITYRVQGEDDVERFRALCLLLRRRPHQLVAELFNAQLAQLFSDNPGLADDADHLVAIARNHRREREIRALEAQWQASR